jgi:hypothetical protein
MQGVECPAVELGCPDVDGFEEKSNETWITDDNPTYEE